ncbi:hypothetical protein Sked_04470 [Sanguibacter keddieii DSM 10542]|uniref:DUF1540 domain-containing protein n=1 Tax=Sanguibacter keddieii (strain ATCC 51767 / DSM 10542 / NCFB 3025 / ST-74) TaxID=446469 RepID=D1BKD5_SANKS|nr:DUF1540 domain-containing protein [Sanguibacter keddieii]ACZ20412.1 hypothetical protein Sked_04470 [Sanguibacter keddieii DSM 10542]
MSALLDLPHVSECSVASCGYNHDGCHAGAVTVAGHAGAAECATFIPLSAKGGLDKVVAHVGACQRSECANNVALECTASSIRIGAGSSAGDLADCLTYTPR